MIGTMFLSVSPALAKDKDSDNTPPPIFQEVIDCKALTDPTERLSCYDTKVAALEAAQASRQVVVADREQIKEARRGLFGFTLPRIRLFGGGGKDKDRVREEEVKEITTTIKSAKLSPLKKWRFVLEDGARWIQTDTKLPARDPKPGDEIRIKRGAIGGYMASIKGQRSIRVKRIN
ncbi:MAG: hypothetical protein AAF067_05395 [Pseudomonadota bacterium]